MPEPNKFLIVKGCNGFCDRLQFLAYAIEYAVRHQRILYVDWNDSIWSEHLNFSCEMSAFALYFDLSNCHFVSTFGQLEFKFKQIWNRPIQRQDVYPNQWLDYGLCKSAPYQDVTLIQDFDITSRDFMSIEIQHPVVIVANLGTAYRAFSKQIIYKHVHLKAWILDMFKEHRLSKLPERYIAIHLRGTDNFCVKPWVLDMLQKIPKYRHIATQTPESNQVPRLPERFLNEVSQLNSDKSIVVVTDDIRLWHLFHPLFPNAQLVSSKILFQHGWLGTHELTPRYLWDRGLTKSDLDIDLLLDFLTLCHADKIIPTFERSSFFSMANQLWTKIS